MQPRDYAGSRNCIVEEHMHMDAREYWYYTIGVALVILVVALA